MQYQIEILSNRFDLGESKKKENINGICGRELLEWIMKNFGYSSYEILNEDWGWGIKFENNGILICIMAMNIYLNGFSFGRPVNPEGPNWKICIVTKKFVKNVLFIKKFSETNDCISIGKSIESLCAIAGDKICSGELEML